MPRPKLSAKERRREYVLVRFTKDELRLLDRVKRTAGGTRAGVVRDTFLATANLKRPPWVTAWRRAQ